MQHSYYLYLQRKLLDRFKLGEKIKYKDVIEFIPTQRIHRDMSGLILYELAYMNLIKISCGANQFKTVEIINPQKCNLLDHPAKIFNLLGTW